MVTTWATAGSSATPPGRAGSPVAPPDTASNPDAPPDRAASPHALSSMIGILSATIPNESNIFRHVMTNILKQSSDSPLAQVLDKNGINEINDLLTLDHQSRNALMY